MGTTTRIIPGVTGKPNWGDLNKSVTYIAKTVEKEKTEQSSTTAKDQQQITREHKKLLERRAAHLKSTFSNLIKTGGGVKAVTSGKSRSIGKAGMRSSTKLAGFFSSVSSSGLQSALTDIGFGSLTGKKFQDIIDYLLIYCSDTNTGLDETAANKASCEALKEIAAECNNDLDAFEALSKELVDGKGLSDLLCRFWGYYIFEHLSQRFQEKITQHRGEDVSAETFKIIRDDIIGQVKLLNEKRPVSKIDWKGKEGKEKIESIFESIIKIICDETIN